MTEPTEPAAEPARPPPPPATSATPGAPELVDGDRAATPAPPAPASPRRGRRWLRRLALASLLTLLAGAAATWWALGHLGHPWVLAGLQRVARATVAAELDLADGALSLYGLRLRGLRLRHPPADDDAVGDAISLQALDVGWDIATWAAGSRRIERVHIQGLRLGLVIDDDGALSWQRALALPTPASPTTPLQPSRSLDVLAAVGEFELPDLRCGPTQVVVRGRGLGVERLTATIPAWQAAIALHPTTPSLRWRLDGEAEVAVAPTEAALAALRAALVPVQGWLPALQLPASPWQAAAAMTARLDGERALRQWRAEASIGPAGRLARAALTLELDPAAGRSSVTVMEARAGEGVVEASLALDIADATALGAWPALHLRRAEAKLALPSDLPGLTVAGLRAATPRGASAEVAVADVRWPAVAVGAARAQLAIPLLTIADAGGAVDRAIEARDWRAEAALAEPTAGIAWPGLRATTKLTAGSAAWPLPAAGGVARASVDDAEADVTLRWGTVSAAGEVALRARASALTARLEAPAPLPPPLAVTATSAAATLTVTSPQLAAALPSAPWRLSTLTATASGAAIEARVAGWSIEATSPEATTAWGEGSWQAVQGGDPAAAAGGRGTLASLSARLRASALRAAGPGAPLAADAVEASLALGPTRWDGASAGGLQLQLLEAAASAQAPRLDGRLLGPTLAGRLTGRELALAAAAPWWQAGAMRASGEVGAQRGDIALDLGDALRWRGGLHLRAPLAWAGALGVTAPRGFSLATFDAESEGALEQARPLLAAVLAAGPLDGRQLRLRHRSRAIVAGVAGPGLRLPRSEATAEGTLHGWRGEHTLAVTLAPAHAAAMALPALRVDATVASEGDARSGLDGWRGLSGTVAVQASQRQRLQATWGLRRGNPWELAGTAQARELGALGRRLGAALPCPDPAGLTLEASGKMRVHAPHQLAALVAWARSPQRWRFDGEGAGTMRGVRCHLGQLDIDVPETKAKAAFSFANLTVQARASGQVARARGAWGPQAFDMHKASASGTFRLRVGDGLRGAELQASAKIGSLHQALVPFWPISEAGGDIEARIDPRGRIVLERLRAFNRGGGSEATVTGTVDRVGDASLFGVGDDSGVPGSRGIELQGELRQNLDALGSVAGAQVGGRIALPFRIESGDLRVFRLQAQAKMEGVRLKQPVWQLEADDLRGELPMAFSLLRDGSAVRPLGGGQRSPWSRWRFADHHPLRQGTHFVALQALRFRGHQIGPLAGNAHFDHDVFRLDQLELNVLGGRVTGQCVVELNGKDTSIQLRGNATELRLPGRSERLDANAAVDIKPWQLAIRGRAQLLRASRHHLLGLLDLADPYREDIQANRARMGLQLGHPEEVALIFRHGFMDMRIRLGGLAEVVQIEDIRGVPLGPLLGKWLAPLLQVAPP